MARTRPPFHLGDLFSGSSPLAVQARVLFALVMREMTTRYGRSAGGYVWALAEPLGFIAMLSIVFVQIARAPSLGESFPLFFATGYLVYHFYMDISSTVSISVQVNKNLMAFPRITLIDTVIARFLLQYLTGVVVSAIILVGLMLTVEDQTRLSVGPLAAAYGLAGLIGLGVGALNCVLFAYLPTWQKLFGIINRPLFLISGVFFVYEDMPPAVREILWWNPLVHATGLARAGFYPVYDAAFASPAYAAACGLAPLFIGILLLRVLRAEILDR